MPKPNKNETREEFISRYMSSEEAKRSHPDEKQRLAIAYSVWREHNKKKSFEVFTPITKSWVEKVSDGNEQFFLEVAVSGLKEDRDGEIMDDGCIKDMITQFKSGTIPLMPDHGNKPNGVRSYSWKDIMGVWVDARQEDDKLMAVARLNKSHPDAELFKSFIKEGMPVGFSIGGRPIQIREEILDEKDTEVTLEK